MIKQSFIIWGFLLFVRILLLILKQTYGVVLIYSEFYLYLDLSIIVYPLILYAKNKKIKWLRNTVWFLTGLTLTISLLIYHVVGFIIVGPTARYLFVSPDGKNTLLLEETEDITGCIIDGYKVVFKIFKIDKWPEYNTRASFGEPDTPVKNGNYRLVWNSNNEVQAIIYSDSREETISIDFK